MKGDEMRNVWFNAGILGTVAFSSVLLSHKTNEPARKAFGAVHEAHSQYELKLVQVLFRHGARTPLKTIPDVIEAQWTPDLLKAPGHTHLDFVVTDESGGPRPPAPVEDSYRASILSGGTYPGQLTTLGMQQLYDLGERLRKQYIQDVPFLRPEFSPAEVYVRSTNIVRTIESAKCLVAGLFQQKQEATVPIITTAAESEIFYPNYLGCKRLGVLAGPRWLQSSLLPGPHFDLKTIQSALGIAPHQKVDFVQIRDDMVAREAHGLPCPPVLDSWRDTVEQRAVEVMCHVYEAGTTKNLQLCVGPVFHTLITNMEDKVGDTSSPCLRKLFLYSVHDTTLIPCLLALGIFDMKWPPYAADVTLELHQDRITKEAFVKVSYLGKDQLIPGCSSIYCPLNKFKKALSAYTLTFDRYNSLCERADGLEEL